jgi:hypothetical protein
MGCSNSNLVPPRKLTVQHSNSNFEIVHKKAPSLPEPVFVNPYHLQMDPIAPLDIEYQDNAIEKIHCKIKLLIHQNEHFRNWAEKVENMTLLKELTLQYNTISDLKADYEELLGNVQNDYSSLLNDISEYKNWKLTASLKNVAKLIKRNISQSYKKYFEIWKAEFVSVNWLQTIDISEDMKSTEDPEPAPVQEEGTCEINIKIFDELLDNNIIVEKYRSQCNKEDKMMLESVAIKLLEDMLDRKYESVMKELKAKVMPTPMPEFLLKHLFVTFGLKNLAYKNLCQLIPTLENMYRKGDKAGIFYCKLLNIVDPEPIPLSLAIALLYVRNNFMQLLEKPTAHKKRNDKKLTRNMSTNRVSLVRTLQGMISLSDAMNLLYVLYENDKSTRKHALRLLKPEKMRDVDYLHFTICFKLSKLGMTPDSFYRVVDKGNFGSVSYKKLVLGLRYYIDCVLSNAEIDTLMRLLNTNEQSRVTLENFVSNIRLDKFFFDSKENNITGYELLSSIYESQFILMKKNTHEIASMFRSYNMDSLPFDIFSKIVIQLNSRLSQEVILKLYSEGLNLSGSGDLTIDGFCRIILDRNIGGMGLGTLGKFYIAIPDLEIAVEDRRPDVYYLSFIDQSPMTERKKDSINNSPGADLSMFGTFDTRDLYKYKM